MNYEKKLKNIFASSGNNALTGFALVSGLAVGAALAILLAPKSGRNLRRGISDSLGEMSDDIRDLAKIVKNSFLSKEQVNEQLQPEEDHTPDYVSHESKKKPKSAIKELIHEAHVHASTL